jgi:hypothetical protein
MSGRLAWILLVLQGIWAAKEMFTPGRLVAWGGHFRAQRIAPETNSSTGVA